NVVYVRTPQETKALVVFHHFVVDAVSWQLLQTQWAQLWEDIVQARTLRALPEAARMRQFTSALHNNDARQQALLEIPFWEKMLAVGTPVFAAHDTKASVQHKRVTIAAHLDADVAGSLLATGHQKFRSRGSDLLFTVFADTVARVCGLDVVTVLM